MTDNENGAAIDTAKANPNEPKVDWDVIMSCPHREWRPYQSKIDATQIGSWTCAACGVRIDGWTHQYIVNNITSDANVRLRSAEAETATANERIQRLQEQVDLSQATYLRVAGALNMESAGPNEVASKIISLLESATAVVKSSSAPLTGTEKAGR
jgi:hypothetical protein